DKTVKMWNPETWSGEEAIRMGKDLNPYLAVSPDSKMLATGGRDNRVHLWDASTGQHKGDLRGHTDPIEHVALSPNGKRLASCSNNGMVKLWDLATRLEVAALKFSMKVDALAFS